MKTWSRRTITIVLTVLVNSVVSLKAQEYNLYCNARYRFCVRYPSSFQMEPAPANDDGRRFHDRSGLVMTASGINNATNETLEIEMRSQSDRFDMITYRAKGQNWLVLSGRKGANILYLKTFVGKGCMNDLSIEYPAQLKAKYDRMVVKVSRSFRPGNLEVAH